MHTTKNDTTRADIDTDLSATAIFELLSNDRRRFALHALSRAVGAVEVSDLADQIALREGEHTHDRYERICTGLVHVHPPKLVEAGVVRFDPERETVQLLDAADKLTPHLDLVAHADTC